MVLTQQESMQGAVMSASSEGSRPPRRIPRGVIDGVIALLLILGGMIGACASPLLPGPSGNAAATAQAQANTTATTQAQANANANATAQAQLNATATAQAQAIANATATAIATGPPIDFSVTTLHAGDYVQAYVPLTIKGTYSSKGSGHVWVVLEDLFRNFYLQNPPVQFNSNGTWTVTNINPELGITMVDFVSVTSAGHKVFLGMVAKCEFGAFHKLPSDANNFLQIPIVVS